MVSGAGQSERDGVLAALAAMGTAELGTVEELRAALHPAFECWMGASRDPLDADGYIDTVREMRTAFTDFAYEVPVPPVVDGNRAATTYRIVGRHTGEYRGVPATGRQLDVGGLSMFEVEDGLVRRMWSAFDSMAMVTQLGLLSAFE